MIDYACIFFSFEAQVWRLGFSESSKKALNFGFSPKIGVQNCTANFNDPKKFFNFVIV
jgi:hypothetical protein